MDILLVEMLATVMWFNPLRPLRQLCVLCG
jgi:hypothetical protein